MSFTPEVILVLRIKLKVAPTREVRREPETELLESSSAAAVPEISTNEPRREPLPPEVENPDPLLEELSCPENPEPRRD